MHNKNVRSYHTRNLKKNMMIDMLRAREKNDSVRNGRNFYK